MPKQNDTRYGLLEQEPANVEGWAYMFSYGLELIRYAHGGLRLDADLYSAVWDSLPSEDRTALRKLLVELPTCARERP